MARVPLVAGAYQARSLIAGAQRCINLYPESNEGDPQAPVPTTLYPTPGLSRRATPALASPTRGLYQATTGDLFLVLGPTLYFVDAAFVLHPIGTLLDRTNQVSMSDNGSVLVVVDGSPRGYVVDLTVAGPAKTFGRIGSANFLGADRVDFIDTYFVFNQPGTPNFYWTQSVPDFATMIDGTVQTDTSIAGAFDSLDFASKTGAADPLATLITVHEYIWLIGTQSTEVFYNSGAADSTFEREPGAFIDHGCAARYSVARQDGAAFWLGQDRDGACIVFKGERALASRVSTHAIEAEFQGYARVDDAIGFVYQQAGHAFYILTFPSADKTWAIELSTGQWHELAWLDRNGALHRHRMGGVAYAYGMNLIADWQNGAIYQLDPDAYTDDGNPIVRVRTFPHMIEDGRRVRYKSFVVDLLPGGMSSALDDQPYGEDFNADFSFDFGPVIVPGRNGLALRWSDDHGRTFGNPIMQDIGKSGEYLRSLMFRRLGMARDRVFEVSWSAPLPTALNGAFVEMEACRS